MRNLILDEKYLLVLLRSVIFVFLTFYTLYGPAVQDGGSFQPFMAAGLQLASILALLPAPSGMFRKAWFQGALFLGDVCFISWAIHASGASSGDLYLVYFIVILVSGMQKTPSHSFAVGAAAATAYALLWRIGEPSGSWLDVSLSLRFPFFFIVAFFSSFFSSQVRDGETRLRAAQERLAESRRLAAVGKLAGGIAHEFNNLLTVVLGNCGDLLEFLDQGDHGREELEEILAASNRMAALTRQFLVFSQGHVSRPVVINLNGFLADRQRTLEDLLGPAIKVELALSPDLDSVTMDPEHLQQALQILASNARDAMPDGGSFTLATLNVGGGAEAAPSSGGGGFVRLRVGDTGCGMDREVLAHVFEPFFTTKGVGKGVGLGLPCIYGIVKKAGGDIAVESRPGQGTAFTIDLPRCPGGRP